MKKIIYMLIGLFLMMGMVSAVIYQPLPINGKVSGLDVENIPITIENVRTGEILTTTTTAYGEFLVDWSNSDDRDGTILKYTISDEFRIHLAECSDDKCVKYVTYNGESNLFVTFDITDAQICPIKVCPDCPDNNCPDLVCPDLTCTPCVCLECPILTCPDVTDWKDMGAGLVLGLITGLVMYFGGGLKIYKNRIGNAVIQHRHKGVTDYHDPNTRHNNLKFRHIRWKDNPLGCIEDVKKINETGGLI